MRIHHVALRTRDVEGLSRFYREVLGLELVRAQEGHSTWLALGPGAVLMIERAAPDEPELPPGSRELLAFATSEAERTEVLTRLAHRGIPVEDATEHTRYFRDPDGRRLAVSSYPLPSPLARAADPV